ncbi:Uncharacterised protein [Enterobacter hormaechei]|nr:Uncharacterised protein [Enterobacter hormaechei]
MPPLAVSVLAPSSSRRDAIDEVVSVTTCRNVVISAVFCELACSAASALPDAASSFCDVFASRRVTSVTRASVSVAITSRSCSNVAELAPCCAVWRTTTSAIARALPMIASAVCLFEPTAAARPSAFSLIASESSASFSLLSTALSIRSLNTSESLISSRITSVMSDTSMLACPRTHSVYPDSFPLRSTSCARYQKICPALRPIC